ncbi:MAG: flagellin domain protein [Gemmatimonadetes bacterium]|nr:flagellin domain protein [Gemmatimonadota bacterium]
MRITSNMMTSQQLAGLQTNMALLQKAQQQVTSGKRLSAPSDDPMATMSIMQSGSSLRALEQYRTSVQSASSRLGIEDSALQQLSDLMSRAKVLGVQASGDTATASTRTLANTEVQQIFQDIVAIGNTKYGKEYLFGGQQSATEPFAATGSGATLDYTSTNPSGQRAVGIGDGQTLAPNHDGTQILVNTGVLDAVKSLSAALDPTSSTYGQAGISAALTKIDAASNAVQSVVGDTGATANSLTVAGQNIDALKLNLTTFKSNLEEVDVETAMTELTTRQVAYQAAMLATSKVMGLTLTDYLR